MTALKPFRWVKCKCQCGYFEWIGMTQEQVSDYINLRVDFLFTCSHCSRSGNAYLTEEVTHG